MKVTKHAYKRARKRLGLSKKALDRHMQKVMNFGIMRKDFEGALRLYLDERFQAHKDKDGSHAKLRVYGRFLYLFSKKNKLITIIMIPSKYNKYLDELKA